MDAGRLVKCAPVAEFPQLKVQRQHAQPTLSNVPTYVHASLPLKQATSVAAPLYTMVEQWLRSLLGQPRTLQAALAHEEAVAKAAAAGADIGDLDMAVDGEAAPSDAAGAGAGAGGAAGAGAGTDAAITLKERAPQSLADETSMATGLGNGYTAGRARMWYHK